MINVSYVKFYQGVQIGPDLLTHVFPHKPRNTKITWDQGLLKIETPNCKTVFVPTANIMFFHQADNEPVVELKQKKKSA